MGFMDEILWEILIVKVGEEDNVISQEQQIGNEYISAVKKICEHGVDRAKTIRDTFPMFTLHDETHICNVMRLMANLLGDDLNKLTRDETAMLIMSACCHDIGMSYSEAEKKELFNETDRLNQYLENNPSEYVKAFSTVNTDPVMTDGMIQKYLRSIHHERVMDLLCNIEWPSVLDGKIDRECLINVCQSHGENVTALNEMDSTSTVDLRFCAILLRLADILDFDTSRAPEAVYRYCSFQNSDDPDVLKSKEEWDKHLSSHGFDFIHIKERTYMYSLGYSATCKSMQVEQAVNCYLDWVDQELNYCSKELKRFAGKWQDFILPGIINRNIKSEGYVSGQYRMSLDQDKILKLLIGDDLYNDPAVFVRELIQNAIDAVRTREQLDKNLPLGWKGQINIRCWMDGEGYHWFRIEDNGIGMTEDIIMNYFLKIGSSYYTSNSFLKSKLQCNADPDYMPISRFGIGILSCFMGDNKTSQVEISTKHFKENHIYYPSLRLSMHGINGYYYLSSNEKKHMPGPMKGITSQEKAQYLSHPGTVIAVRTNLYQTGKYRGFKEIVDKYVIYPQVAIHYDGDDGSCDYPTEDDFSNALKSICSPGILGENGEREFEIPNEELSKRPDILFKQPPKLLLKCIPLENYTRLPYLKGALLIAEVEYPCKCATIKLGNKNIEVNSEAKLFVDQQTGMLKIKIIFYYDLCISLDEKEDIAVLKDASFNICSLFEFSWYNKYFKKFLNRTESHSIVAHNGVFCGDASFFYNGLGKSNFGAIILLKDKYRPDLDVARDGVHGLSLEAASEINIIRRRLRSEGCNFVGDLSYLREENYPYIVMGDYCKLLEERDDLAEQLIFDTEEGMLSNEKLANKLLNKEMIEYKSFPTAPYDWKKNDQLYNCLCTTYLRNNYLLQIMFLSDNSIVFISKKREELPDNYKQLFPACLFLPEINKNTTILTTKERRRRGCNEYHRLSQFILNNGLKLKEYATGIFRELLRTLLEDEEDKLINNVNSLLENLRKYPGGLFPIPDELFISEKDLV